MHGTFSQNTGRSEIFGCLSSHFSKCQQEWIFWYKQDLWSPNNHILAKSHMHSTFSQNTGSSEIFGCLSSHFSKCYREWIFWYKQDLCGPNFLVQIGSRIVEAQITIFWQNHTCTAHLAKILEVRKFSAVCIVIFQNVRFKMRASQSSQMDGP